MKRLETVAVGIIVVLVIVVSTIAVFDLLTPPKTNQHSTSLPFVVQPVVDVIVPSLYTNQGSNNDNIPLNVTGGQVVILAVNIYSTANLNFTMEYRVLSYSGGTENDSATIASSLLANASFSPETLVVQGDGNGTTKLTVAFSSSAVPGEYNSVITAVNLDNSSQEWGDILQVNVTG